MSWLALMRTIVPSSTCKVWQRQFTSIIKYRYAIRHEEQKFSLGFMKSM
uniref:Uncharacterized protein n=1 Tax=Arundo donax TaxID=35708 RepID=A0A0A9APV3_ARUDO